MMMNNNRQKTILEVFGSKSKDGDEVKGLLNALMRNSYKNGGRVPKYKKGSKIEEAEASNIASILALKKFFPKAYEQEIDISDYTPHGTYSESGFEKKHGFDPGTMAIDTLAYDPGVFEKLLISGKRGGKEDEITYTKEGLPSVVEMGMNNLVSNYLDPSKTDFRRSDMSMFADKLEKSFLQNPEQLEDWVSKFEKKAK